MFIDVITMVSTSTIVLMCWASLLCTIAVVLLPLLMEAYASLGELNWEAIEASLRCDEERDAAMEAVAALYNSWTKTMAQPWDSRIEAVRCPEMDDAMTPGQRVQESKIVRAEAAGRSIRAELLLARLEANRLHDAPSCPAWATA